MALFAKVGGSLYDLPDLGSRLRAWLSTLRSAAVVLVPGGGPLADAVRDLDRVHALGAESSHWLALGALALNAHFLAQLVPGARVVADPCGVTGMAILDALAFLRADEDRPGCLPHSWEVTSDTVAARAAEVAGAAELVLLKSADFAGGPWEQAGQVGFVDPVFATVVRRAGLRVQAVNLRR
jgi:aspartokinase-like uncharacterized kinase